MGIFGTFKGWIGQGLEYFESPEGQRVLGELSQFAAREEAIRREREKQLGTQDVTVAGFSLPGISLRPLAGIDPFVLTMVVVGVIVVALAISKK